jgi:hypothetical protein
MLMLRFEATRTEIDQIRYMPLGPYREQDQVGKQCQPSQQMANFFVCTQQFQQEHRWQTPPYRFKNNQKKSFQRSMAAARQEITSVLAGGEREVGSM